MKPIVRVASGQGFWGDWLEAPRRQVEGGPVDYLMLDYLAEVTMSILQKQRERDPSAGYARDFLGAVESILPAITERGVRVIANAGGVNPRACADAVLALLERHGSRGAVRLGVVTGDDLLPNLDALLAAGHPLANMETGEPLAEVRDRVLAANAYIGSGPIVEALGRGAQVVITGRSTDTALTMAPLRFEFGWAASRLEPAGRGHRRRSHHRMRRAVLRRQLPLRVANDPRSRQRWLPHRRGASGRHLRGDEAPRHRRSHLRTVGLGAAGL